MCLQQLCKIARSQSEKTGTSLESTVTLAPESDNEISETEYFDDSGSELEDIFDEKVSKQVLFIPDDVVQLMSLHNVDPVNQPDLIFPDDNLNQNL